MSLEPTQAYRSVWNYLMETPFKQGYVTVGGLNTRYVEAGEPEMPKLVLLHGTGGHWEAFCANLGPLSKHFHCFAFDLMGCGFTDKPDKPYEIASYVEHALAFMDHMGVKRASLIGVSLGSWIGARLAQQNPDRVERMILIAPPGLLALPKSVNAALNTRRASAADPSWKNITSVMERLYYDPKTLMDDLVAVRQRVYSLPGLDKIMPRMLTLFDPEIRMRNNLTTEEWKGIKTPTLVVEHIDSPDLYLDTARELQKLIPNIEAVVMPKTSHWPQFENPDFFNRVAVEFLAGKPASKVDAGVPKVV